MEQKRAGNIAFYSLLGIVVIAVVAGIAYFVGKGGISLSLKSTTPPVATNSSTPIPTSTISDEELIKQAVYAKFGTDETKTNVTVSKIQGNYAKGGIKDVASEVGGGYFIAAKSGGIWIIVHDGQANPTCAQIAAYSFPTDMVPECLDASGNPITR